MKIIAVIYGTRPEAIKLAPVIAELKASKDIRTLVICSGQHKEMLEGIMELWHLSPDVVLDYDFNSGHSSSIPNLMLALEKVFLKQSLNLILVQGDTATATAAAMQAHALHIPVAHVEAGLRSKDLWNPWPEESNRRIIDSISSLHFAPTMSAGNNLANEGYSATVTITGNTVVDALKHASRVLDNKPDVRMNLENQLGFSLNEKFILLTQHRREGFAGGQTQVFEAVLKLAEAGHRIVFPVHLNPLVRDKVREMLLDKSGIFLLNPQTYLPFLELTRMSRLIISDSGGLQEEVPTFGKNILITRLTTERPEIVESGFGQLVGYDSELIYSEAVKIISDPKDRVSPPNPFGDGRAAKKIQEIVLSYLND